MLFDCIAYLFCGYLAVISLYIIAVALLSYFQKTTRVKRHDAPMIGVIIPAHNEEMLLPRMLESIARSEYPPERIQLFVIADNCTDRTAELARKAGATVVERSHETLLGKGYALDYFLKECGALYEEVDAFAIIDADTLVDSLFFHNGIKTLTVNGVEVVQGLYTVHNVNATWLTRLYHVAFLCANYLRPRGRDVLGASTALFGNGMLFRKELLQKYGWPCHTFAEDLQMSLFLLKAGHRIAFDPEAIVRGEMPEKAKQAESQKERWEAGRLTLFLPEFGGLLSRFFRTGAVRYLDALLDLAVPPLSLFLLLAGMLTPFLLLGSSGELVVTTWVMVLGAIAMLLISTLIQTRQPISVWFGLAAAPFYLLFKIPLYLKMVLSPEKKWTRTER